jgi:hypothetical protein
MPGIAHEALVQLVRRAPEIVPSLMWPEEQVAIPALIHVTAAEFIDLNLPEYRADAVLALGGAPGSPDQVLVVEVQLEVDKKKRRSWPQYVTGLHARHDCPVGLVVIAPERRIAGWCREPIDLGFGCCVVRPWVLGPDDIPVIDDPEQALAAPELAILSVAAHAAEPAGERVALAALQASAELDGERRLLYPDFVLGLLGQRARALLEQLMSSAPRYYSEIFQNHYDRGLAAGEAAGEAKGKAEGKAEMLLKLCVLKGFAPGEDERQKILTCTDPALLDTWAARVLTATSLRDVLGDAG